jgi:hypothetical protein
VGTRAAISRATVAFMLGAIAASQSPARAETMIRYERPVFHNGHRVLYHGAWRSHGHAKAKADEADDDKSDDKAVAKSAPAASSAHEYIVLVDPDDATSLRMATELVNSAAAAGLKARAWAGKTSPDALAKFAATDGGDFAVAPIDVLAVDPKYADARAQSPLVARLAAEPLVVIANANVADVQQLEGRPVAFGETGGVIDATGQAVFAKLGVTPKVVHLSVTAALAALASGQIDAMAVLGADESRAINDASKAGKLHALAVPWRDAFAGYAPVRLTGKDLPKLVPDDGSVETVGAPFGLIAVDAADGSMRAAQDQPFVSALFERHQQLLGAAADPKWRDVNLTAETDWPRLACARDWIAKHPAAADPALDDFRETARSAAGGAEATVVADKLYADLLRAKGVGP